MSSNAPTDSVCLTVPSHARYLGLVRKVIQQVSQEGGFTEDEGRKLILAVDEACSNVIKHSYDNDPTSGHGAARRSVRRPKRCRRGSKSS